MTQAAPGSTQRIGTVVLATHNAKKLAELRRIVDESGVGLRVLGLDDVAPYPEPVETERTFEGNALLKARAAVAASGLPALADDSGIAVEAFNGMPGVRSARWAGPDASDAENLDLLLRQMSDLDAAARAARFVCAMALVLPEGDEEVVVRDMQGRMGREKRGDNGFGYDPAFVADGNTLTNGELSPGEKDAISHRGLAVRAMLDRIEQLNLEVSR